MKKTLRISFNGKTFDVVAEILGAEDAPAPRAVAVATAAAAAQAPAVHAHAPAATGAGEVASPLAGKVVSIDAKVGTVVKTGQNVLTLEAMKMNTMVSAHADGTVAEVHVNAGDSVEEGQLLMTIK